jgi:hypothetical protein
MTAVHPSIYKLLLFSSLVKENISPSPLPIVCLNSFSKGRFLAISMLNLEVPMLYLAF